MKTIASMPKKFEISFGLWPRILKRDAKSYMSSFVKKGKAYSFRVKISVIHVWLKGNIFDFKKSHSDVMKFQLH